MRLSFSKLAGVGLLICSGLLLSACDAISTTQQAEGNIELQRITDTGEVSWTYGCLGTAQDAIEDLNCRKIRIGVENAYLPFNYIEAKTGLAGGWDYEAWNAVCTRLHCAPVFVETPWDGMIDAVANREFDVGADGITINDERKEKVDFSDAYISIEQRLLVRSDEARFENIQELADQDDLKVGSQDGTTNLDTAIEYVGDERVTPYAQFPEAIQALLDGDIDAVVIDETTGQGYVTQNGDALKMVGPSLSSDQLGFIFPKGSDLVGPVNKALASMRSAGVLETLAVSYFGPFFQITQEDIAPPSYSTQP